MNNQRTTIFFILFIVVLMVVFETLQQLFYINRFQPQLNTGFIEVLKSQLMKWLVWFVFSVFIGVFVKNLVNKAQVQLFDFIKLFFLILLMISIDIFIISLLSFFYNEHNTAFYSFMRESMVFFAYQKTPIYSLSYICFSAVIYFHFTNMKLKVEISNFGHLKLENAQLYQQLAAEHEDRATVLKIKMGNSYKVIPVKNIYWLQADDYCVNVHLENAQIYSLRKSLKALEKIMPINFLRVHRGAIVNMQRIAEFQTNGANILVLKNGFRVPVSKSKSALVKKFMASNQ